MKHLLKMQVLALLLISYNVSGAQDIKEQYADEDNGQNTVIVKDKEISDLDILNQLDIDDYSVGQEVRITPEMLEQLKKQEELSNPEAPAVKQDWAISTKEEKHTEVASPVYVEEKPIEKKASTKAEKPEAKPNTSTKKSTKTTSKRKKSSAKRKKTRRKKVKKKTKRQIFNRRGKGVLGCYTF